MIEVLRFREHRSEILIAIVFFIYWNSNLCWSLNDEGLALLRFRERVVSDPFGALSNWNDDFGVLDPCSWFGVECLDRNVVALNLEDLCLGGTLSPGLGKLVHIKSIILRNNSFYGKIPEVIGELKELQELDLGYNNFSGPFPSELGNNLSLAILLLDNNELFGSISPEIHELEMISEVQVNEKHLSNSAQGFSCNKRSISWNIAQTGDVAKRKLLEVPTHKHKKKGPKTDSPSSSPSPSPSSSPSPAPSSSPSPAPTSSTVPKPNLTSAPAPKPNLTSAPATSPYAARKQHLALILSLAIGGPVLLLVMVISIFFFKSNKMTAVRPWATGLSGQLSKAFVTGVPKLKRPELEAACEDFSNVVGSSSIGMLTVYKGTLSNGVEIAVASVAETSSKDWSDNLEAQFRNKIDSLSEVNHKNFVNLLGYCEDAEPFTRMLVFEYAPNGTLFEHLHIKEAEHLDWSMRMRIMMGMAYCFEHMHQLTPPIAHKNLNSAAVNLTEDYAAKVSDLGFWSEVAEAEMESNPESNVYSFGVVLFEMVTGRLPYSVNNGSVEDWASDYLRREQPLREMVDPTLKSFQSDQLEQISEVITSCAHPDPKQRPQMREVTARLREITAMGPDGAVPRLNPLWWAELEILSTDAN